jgi:hypothetical protein
VNLISPLCSEHAGGARCATASQSCIVHRSCAQCSADAPRCPNEVDCSRAATARIRYGFLDDIERHNAWSARTRLRARSGRAMLGSCVMRGPRRLEPSKGLRLYGLPLLWWGATAERQGRRGNYTLQGQGDGEAGAPGAAAQAATSKEARCAVDRNTR